MGIENIGLIIAELRKNMKMTQEKLAKALSVSDKAISKWETGNGYPDISMLPLIAELFNVSVDFLLTGKTIELKPISKLELCAKKDDVEMFEEIEKCSNLFDVRDEENHNLFDYVFQYESVKVFGLLIRSKSFAHFERNRLLGSMSDDLIRLAILSNEVSFIKKYNLQVFGFKLNPHSETPTTNIQLTKILLCDPRVNEDTIRTILGLGELIPNYTMFSHFVDACIEFGKSKWAKELLDYGIKNNQNYKEKYEQTKSKNQGSFTPSQGGVVHGPHGQPVMYFLEVPKSTIIKTLDKLKFDFAIKMNEINKMYYSGKAFIASQYEFDSRKISNDKSITDKEKREMLVVHSGILNVDELIALDDYKAYAKLIKLPASVEELIWNLIEEKNYKELLKVALDVEAKYPWLAEAVLHMDSKFILEKNRCSQYQLQENSKLLDTKKVILFEKIIKNKDIEFFQIACQTDSKNLDWALESINPSRFDVIHLLLSKGAKLHRRYTADDGWGYLVEYDEIDEIGTELLKRKIDEFIGGKR